MDLLTIVALLVFALAGLSWVLLTFVFTQYKKYAVAVAAILAAVGGAILIINAIINPDSIQIPEVEIPEVSIPPINR